MPKSTPSTWMSYMKTVSKGEFSLQQEELLNVAPFILPTHQFRHLFLHNVPCIYIADYTSGTYRMMTETSKETIGHKSESFLKGGIQFTIENYHPDDLKLFNEQIFPDRLQILKNIPPAEHHKYVFSYTYRMKKKNYEYITLLQRNCFIQSGSCGTPLLSMGMVLNVGHHTPASPVVQVVEYIGTETEDTPSLVFNKHYFPHDEARVFSKRETEILKATADGLSYKEIAACLCIAPGTVLQHRKRMLQKSNTKNVAELVLYAIKNHYL